MIRRLATVAAMTAALALTCQSANAQWRNHDDPRITAASIGVGAASTAAYFGINHWHWKWDSNRAGMTSAGAFALTTIGCMAVSPMVATVLLNRPLTMREGDVLAVSCVIPIIGGWLVNAAYDAHPEWEAGDRPVVKAHYQHRHHHRRHKAKM